MNEHDSILALIPGYPELRTPERQRVDAHAQTCQVCATALERQQWLRSQLAHAPRLVPSSVAVEAVRASIRQRALPPAARRNASRPRWLTAAVPAGALVLVAVLVGLLFVRQDWLPGSDSTSSAPSGRGQGNLPAARSAAVGEFVWQTDDAYGYQMLRPAGWTMTDTGSNRDFTAPTPGEGEALSLHVLNLRAKPIAETRWGIGALRDKFEAAPTLDAWTARIEEFDFKGMARIPVPDDLAAESAVYLTQTQAERAQLMAVKVSEGQPLLIALAGGAAARDLDALKANGLWDDFLTMLRSAHAIPLDPQNVAPPPQNPTVAPQATPTNELPATCAVEAPNTLLLASGESGYCLRYPAAFRPRFGTVPDWPAGTWGVSFYDPNDANRTLYLDIQTSLANGRTLQQAVAEKLSQIPAEITAQVTQTPSTLGGEPAIILDGLPGVLTNRQVFVIQGDRLHRLVLFWQDDAFADRQAEAQALWDQVASTLAFVPALNNSYLNGLLQGEASRVTLLEAEASGLKAQLTAVDLTESELSAEFCLDLPDSRDWHPMPRLSQGERRAEGYSMSLVDAKLTQTRYATHRCYRYTSSLPSPGVSVAEPLTLSIERLALEPVEGELGQAATCEAALQRLAERQTGIRAECVDGMNGTFPEPVSLPEGMTRDQAQRLIGEAYSEFVYGPWTFSISPTNGAPAHS